MALMDSWLPQIDTTTIVLFIAILVLVTIIQSWTGGPKNLPPFPARSYPFVGHLPYLAGNPRELIAKWTKEQGEIFSLYFGKDLTIFLNSFDIIKEALVKMGDSYSHRPWNVIVQQLGYKEGKGLVSLSGQEWKEQRAITQTILRQFGMGKSFLALKIQEEVKCFLDEIAKYKGEAKDVRTLTTNSVSNNICSILLGKRFEYEDPHFVHLLKMLNDSLRLAGNIRFFSHRFIKYIPGDLFGLKELGDCIDAILNELGGVYIKDAKTRIDTSDESDHYVLAYLREMKKREIERPDTTMNDVNLLFNCHGLFLAGTETTATTLLWFMLYMINFPNVQEKCYKEIVDVIGLNRSPQMVDKDKMTYYNATMMETQRRASIVPFNLVHETSTETTIRGYTIPKGTKIVPQLDSVLYDEKVWKEPMKFDPEHFLDKNGELDIPEQFIPFSIGRRVCAGESLAKMELFLYATSLLQRFQLKPADPNNPPPMEEEYGFTLPPKPFTVRFVERHS